MNTQWMPGLIVLGVASLLGALFLVLNRRQDGTSTDDTRLLDLEREAQLRVEQLRALATDRHHLDDTAFAAERARLEQAAAVALRNRDAYVQGRAGTQVGDAPQPAAVTSPPPARGFGARHPQLVGAAWGALVVAFLGGMGVWVVSQERPRGEGEITGGGPPTGASPNTSAPSARGPDVELEALRDRVSHHPADLLAQAELGHALILRGGLDEALALTERTLGADPYHLESRIHRAVLASMQGDLNVGFRDLEHLSRVYPGTHEALFFLGAISLQVGDAPRALDSLERFAAEAPPSEHPPELGAALEQLRQQVRGAP